MDITGKTIVLTGKFSQIDRKEAERLLTDMGARCSSSVSAKTDILFAGEKAGSKLAAATKLGVAVFGESDLMVVLGLAGAAEVEVEDADVLELLSHGKAVWLSNTPHSTDVVTFGMSHSGEYFATGAWCGDDYDAGGSLAIWETATGRCVNVYPRIQGGAGWPDYGGCIQWSRDDLRVGLAFDTNGVGYVDPFGNTPEVQNFVYATDGLSRPPGWCWAPDSARVFVSCWGWRESSLAGAIGAPSAYGSKPVYMEKTGQEESDADALQPFVSMVWSDDGRVVGYSRHGDVYAIDTTSRKLVWQTKIAGPVAICPDGSLVACHDRGLKWLDGKTGEVVAEPKFVGGGDLVFSADGQFLLDVCHAENKNHVTPCVRVYKGFELISVLDCEPAVSDSWRLENVQAKMSLDGTLVAVICADGVLRVFTVADEKEVFSMPAQGATDVFFAADNRIVLASDERLAFVQPSGELLIAHALKEFPAEDPLTEKLPGSNLCAFVNGERWGYATGALVVAGSDPENLVQAVVGRRRAYPPSVVGATIYPSLADAVAAHPKAFAKPVRDLVQKAKPSKAKASKFPPPNTHAARDVEDYLLAQLRDQDPSYSSAYRAEVAIHRILHADVEGARAALKDCGSDARTGLVLAHVAAYAARTGDLEFAHALIDQAERCSTDDSASYIQCRRNFIVVAKRLMGEACDEAIGLEFAQGEWENQSLIADTAVAHLFLGEISEAFAQIHTAKSGIWWHDIAEFIVQLFQTDDLEVLRRFAGDFKGSEHIQHFDVLERLVSRLLELDAPEDALESLEAFSKLSVSEQATRIVEHVASRGDSAQFEAFAQKVRAQFQNDLSVLSALLVAHNRLSGADSHRRILDFLVSAQSSGTISPWNLTGMIKHLVLAFQEAGLELEPLLALTRVKDGPHWAYIWAALPEGDANESEARTRTLASYDFMGSQSSFEALRATPDRFEALFERGLEVAGRDRYNLGYLVESMCGVGDFERAHVARMKIAKSARAMATETMVYGLLAAGEFTAALDLAAELDHGFGSCGREYTLMRGLVRGPWNTGSRTSRVM